MAPNFETAKQRYESMAADGTAAHSAQAWRTMSTLLTEAALTAPAGMARPLYDRSDDCLARAARVAAIRNYSGVAGAGFRTDERPEWKRILDESGLL
jgi:hypothetical protein